MKTKRCSGCKVKRSLKAFTIDRSQTSGLSCRCRDCRSVERKKRYQAGENARMAEEYISKTREERYLKKYNITLAEYDVMLEEQDNECAICGITPEDAGKRLYVDHDHETGDVRGLLCSMCNSGLGMFQDKIVMLKRALKYLETEV